MASPLFGVRNVVVVVGFANPTGIYEGDRRNRIYERDGFFYTLCPFLSRYGYN